ncbi:MAG: hypothetical protein ACI9CA_000339 [Natronomonas sp.]|jgi:hypothetical protein
MTSRRNFVIGAGTLLTGSGAFLGSGAFGVGNAENPENWVPVGVRTPASEGFEPSTGLPQDGDSADRDTPRGDDRDEGDTGGGDDSADTGDSDAGGGGDDGDSTDLTEDTDDSDDSSGGPTSETSIRLQVTGPEMLSSEHVLTAGDGRLRGLRLENLNRNALTYVGETSDGRFPDPGAGDQVAFLVVNDGDVAVDLSVDVDGAAPEVLNFPTQVDAAVSGTRRRDLTAVSAPGLPPGGVVHVVVEVDTTVVDPLPDGAVEAVTFVADPA